MVNNITSNVHFCSRDAGGYNNKDIRGFHSVNGL